MTDLPDPHAINLDDGTEQPPHHDPHAHVDPEARAPWERDDTPPPPPDRPASTGPRRSTDLRRLHDKLMQMYASIGLVTCAAAAGRAQLAAHADDVRHRAELLDVAGRNTVALSSAAADAWVELAAQDPRVKSALLKAVEGGAVASVVMTNAMILIPYGVAMGWLPEQFSQGIMQMQAMARAAEQNGSGGDIA